MKAKCQKLRCFQVTWSVPASPVFPFNFFSSSASATSERETPTFVSPPPPQSAEHEASEDEALNNDPISLNDQ